MQRTDSLLKTQAYAPQSEGEFTNLLSPLYRRPVTVLVVLLTAGGMAAAAYFAIPAVHESKAQVLIVRRELQGDTAGPAPAAGADAAVHENVFSSPSMIRRAMEQGRLAELPSIAGYADPVERIGKSLSVERELLNRYSDENALFSLSFRSGEAADCPQVLSALIRTYEEFLNDIEQEKRQTRRPILAKWRDNLAAELKAKRDEYDLLNQAHGSPGNPGDETLNVAEARLAGLHTQKLQLNVQRSELKRQQEVLLQARRDGIDPALFSELTARWAPASRPNDVLQDDVGRLRLHEKEIRAQLGPNHPEVRALREQTAVLPPGTETAHGAPATPDKLTAYIHALDKELQILEQVEGSLESPLEAARDAMSRSADAEHRAQLLRTEVDGLQQLYRSVSNQLEFLELAHGTNAFRAEIVSAPELGKKVAPSGMLLAVVAGVIGLMAGWAAALVRESKHRELRNPDDVLKWLSAPTVAGIPHIRRQRIAGNKSNVDRMLAAWNRPQSAEAEAFRSLATVLGGQHAQSFLITSPKCGEGKSLIAANLACAIAQTGRRVLLIDAGTTAPCQHLLFNCAPSVGLAAVLSGEASLEDACIATSVPGVSLLPAGSATENSASLFHSPRLPVLLTAAQGGFDIVLLDGPAVLHQSEAWILAPLVDRVLVVVEFGREAQPAERACQVLIGLRADVQGILINRVSRRMLMRYDQTFFAMPTGPQPGDLALRNGHHPESSNGLRTTTSHPAHLP